MYRGVSCGLCRIAAGLYSGYLDSLQRPSQTIVQGYTKSLHLIESHRYLNELRNRHIFPEEESQLLGRHCLMLGSL